MFLFEYVTIKLRIKSNSSDNICSRRQMPYLLKKINYVGLVIKREGCQIDG